MIIDLCCGAGGASRGIEQATGIAPIGIDTDKDSCFSHQLAGHPTVRGDITRFDPSRWPVEGIWASVPCKAFSVAGKQEGKQYIDRLIRCVSVGDWRTWPNVDPAIWLALEIGRWAEITKPSWLICEQVRPVMPLWEAYAERWRKFGWSTWCGVLNAADYGIPQTRQRAFMFARPDGQSIQPPSPTHGKAPEPDLFGELKPWNTMAEALGWNGVNHPSPTLTAGGTDTGGYEAWPTRSRKQVKEWVAESWAYTRPSTTIVSSFRPDIAAPPTYRKAGDGPRQNQEGAIKLSIEDALILQGFDPDTPLHGSRTSKFRQVGNAVPPPWAAAIVRAVTS